MKTPVQDFVKRKRNCISFLPEHLTDIDALFIRHHTQYREYGESCKYAGERIQYGYKNGRPKKRKFNILQE